MRRAQLFRLRAIPRFPGGCRCVRVIDPERGGGGAEAEGDERGVGEKGIAAVSWAMAGRVPTRRRSTSTRSTDGSSASRHQRHAVKPICAAAWCASWGSNSKRTGSNELRKILKEKEFSVSLSVSLENARF